MNVRKRWLALAAGIISVISSFLTTYIDGLRVSSTTQLEMTHGETR